MTQCVTHSLAVRKCLDGQRIPYILEQVGLTHAKAVFDVDLDQLIRLWCLAANEPLVIRYIGCHQFEILDLPKACCDHPQPY